MAERIQTGGVLPIAILAVTKSGAPLTGATDLFIRVFRRSDNFFIDWADDTFKASGHTTINQILAEVNATNAAGVYEFAGDWDTSTIVSPVADDSYVIYPLQTPGTNAVLPGPIDVLTGEFVDDIDAAITSRATQADILSDATPFDGADIDAAISSRAAPGAAMDLVAGAVDAAAIATDAIDADAIAADAIGSSELATSAVNEIRDAILSDSTAFQGADVAAILADTAAIDSRLPSDPADESLQQAAHSQTQSDIAALNDLSAQDTRDAMKLTPTAGAPAAGSVDEHLDDTLADTSAIDSRLPSDPADESLQQAAHTQTQADIAALNDLSQSDVLSDATPFAGANVDAAISSRSSQASQDSLRDAIVANDLVVGAGSSTTEVRTGATQATGFYDDMMIVVINSAGTVARVVSAYNNTNGAFTVATLPFTPAASDRAIVIALDQAAAGGAPSVGAIADAVWDEDVVAAHGTADTGGLLLRALGALISQRSNTPTLEGLLGVPDTASEDIATAIDTELAAQHGSGQWDGTDSDWTAGEREQIRFRLAMDGSQADPTTSAGTIEDILADTAAVDSRLPSDPADESLQQAAHTQTQSDIAALNDLAQSDVLSDGMPFAGANVDAAVSSRSTQASVDSLSTNQVAVSTTAASGSSPTEVRTPLTQADNFFDGMFVLVINTAGVAVRRISEYKNTNGAFTLDESLPFTPAISDVVSVLTSHESISMGRLS